MKAHTSLALVAFFVIFLTVIPFAAALAAESPQQAKTLYSAAVKCESSKDYQKAKDMYAQLVQQFPDSASANDAKLNIPKMDILSAIETGRDKNVQPMIDKLCADFSSHPMLYKALYGIAQRFEGTKNFAKAQEMYGQIAQRYPACAYYGNARIGAARVNVLNLIESGADAQAAVDKLIADFGQEPDFAKTLYSIAFRYERTKKFDKAVITYQQVIQKCPGSSYADDAQLDIRKVPILSLIEDGNDAQTQIDKLQSDFAGNSALPAALYRIAESYEGKKTSDFYDKAGGIYQKIVQAYPGNNYAAKSQLDAAKLTALKAMTSGTNARGTFDKLMSDFSGNAGLPGVLYWVVRRYEDANKFDKARDMYRVIADSFPQSAYSEQALLYCAEANVRFLIESGNIDDAQTSLDKLTTDFAGNSNIPELLVGVADTYYKKGMGAGEQTPDANNAYWKKSAAALELAGNAVGQMQNAGLKAKVYYIIGLNQDKLGNYLKASQAFENSYQADQGFEYADYCLFAQGKCSEKLMEQKAIPEADAKAAIKAVYTQLVSKFPKSRYSRLAASWIERH